VHLSSRGWSVTSATLSLNQAIVRHCQTEPRGIFYAVANLTKFMYTELLETIMGMPAEEQEIELDELLQTITYLLEHRQWRGGVSDRAERPLQFCVDCPLLKR